MIPPNDFDRRREEIQSLICVDKLDQALSRLMDFVRDFSEDRSSLNDSITIKARCSRVERFESQGKLTFQEATAERVKIIDGALALLDSVGSSLALAIGA
jgi:hypothetical protein